MDIALIQQPNGTFDVALAGMDLQADNGMQTAIILSLFCDRRAELGDELPNAADTNRRGWWADSYADVQGDLWGSRLWLLERAKQIPETLTRAEEYAAEALQWLIDDGVAKSVDVTASFPSAARINLVGNITKPDGTAVPFSYDYVWRDLNAV